MIVTYSCSRCESPNLVRNGHDYKGSQKYHCKDCGQYGTLNTKRGYDASAQAQVKRGMLERLSLRGLARMMSISRRTLSRWLVRWIDEVPPLEYSLLPAELEDVLELDELWSFVGNKQQARWLWLALCRRTRQVVSYWIGDRSETGALQLWRRIPHQYVRCASFSDRWQAYAYIFDPQRHRMVGKEEGETNHVERWFNTLRQRLARFTRKTLAFSKRDDLHHGLLRMFIYDYNLSCIRTD
jgi:IS1 family transposase/transposase-like protein